MTMQISITERSSSQLERQNLTKIIEIGHCMSLLKTLSEMADIVNKNPSAFDDTTKTMAHIIREIKNSI